MSIFIALTLPDYKSKPVYRRYNIHIQVYYFERIVSVWLKFTHILCDENVESHFLVSFVFPFAVCIWIQKEQHRICHLVCLIDYQTSCNMNDARFVANLTISYLLILLYRIQTIVSIWWSCMGLIPKKISQKVLDSEPGHVPQLCTLTRRFLKSKDNVNRTWVKPYQQKN